MLIWGDPSLSDSSLRIAERLKKFFDFTLRVLLGLASLKLLTAEHAIPLNIIGEPVVITTGRKLLQEGRPKGIDTLVIMLDGDWAFQHITPDHAHIVPRQHS